MRGGQRGWIDGNDETRLPGQVGCGGPTAYFDREWILEIAEQYQHSRRNRAVG